MDTLKYPTPQALMEDTCNAIREKDGTSEKIDHQDVPDRIRAIPSGGSDIDLSGITAQRGDVSERVQFMDSSGKLDYGSMPEIADDTVILDGDTPEHGIPGGHHTGGGKVKIVPDLSNIFTPTKEQQEFSPADGTVFTKIILDPIPDIYVDKTGADASTSEVLEGAKFIGASGTVEEGGIHKVTGALTPITTNGTKTFMRGKYYDNTVSVKVDVPQNIVSGENSTGTTATAEDIRNRKTARSGGAFVTGTMPDVDAPSIAITKYISTYGGTRKLMVSASSAATESGYLERGKTANTSLDIPVYSEYNGDSLAITPGRSAQYFSTAGKYVEANLKVEAVPVYTGPYEITPGDRQELPTSGLLMTEDLVVKAIDKSGQPVVLIKNVDCSTGKTEQLNITKVPSEWKSIYSVIVSRQTTYPYSDNMQIKVVNDMYWEDSDEDGDSEYFSMTALQGGEQDSSSCLRYATGYHDLEERNQIVYTRTGTTIQINTIEAWFYGVYRVIVIGIH